MKSITQVVQNLIKPYIDSHNRAAEAIIAPVETDATSASDDYAIGKQLILNNVLYDVIAPITAGDALVVNTNIKAANNVSSDIDALTKKLEDEAATRSALSAKNLLPFDLDAIKALNTAGTWASNVYSYRGVDFTVNPDGTILADGQATGGNASIKVFAATSSYEMLGKNVILNGCPNGGSATTYRIQAYRMGSADGSSGTYFDDGDGTVAFDALNNASGTVGSFAVAVYENYDADNLLFKPMVRLSTDSNSDYQPYAMTNRELTAEKQTLTNNVSDINTALGNEVATRAKVSGHNLLKYSLTTGTNNEVVYTVNPDKTISVTTTEATASARFTSLQADLSNLIHGETYILNGCPSGGAIGTYVLYLADGTDDYVDAGEGIQFVYDSNKTYILRFVVYASVNLTTPIVFKPMIRLATDANSDYEPYSMTNQELTPIAQAVSNRNLLDNPWFTVNQRGQSTYNLTGNGMTVDRWAASVSSGTMIVGASSNGLAITEASDVGDGGFIERINKPELLGKTVTISIDDGTNIYHATGTIPNVQPVNWTEVCSVTTSGGINAALFISPVGVTAFQLQYVIRVPKDNTAYTIRAVKLELGSVSTLAQDTAPNYAEELMKCQRYCRKISLKQAVGFLNAGGLVLRFIHLYTENMYGVTRTVQIPSDFPVTLHFAFGGNYVDLQSADISGVVCDTDANGYSGSIAITLSQTGQVKVADHKGKPFVEWNYDDSNYVLVSADL